MSGGGYATGPSDEVLSEGGDRKRA